MGSSASPAESAAANPPARPMQVMTLESALFCASSARAWAPLSQHIPRSTRFQGAGARCERQVAAAPAAGRWRLRIPRAAVAAPVAALLHASPDSSVPRCATCRSAHLAQVQESPMAGTCCCSSQPSACCMRRPDSRLMAHMQRTVCLGKRGWINGRREPAAACARACAAPHVGACSSGAQSSSGGVAGPSGLGTTVARLPHSPLNHGQQSVTRTVPQRATQKCRARRRRRLRQAQETGGRQAFWWATGSHQRSCRSWETPINSSAPPCLQVRPEPQEEAVPLPRLAQRPQFGQV